MTTDAGVGRLVISHISTSSTDVLEESLGHLRETYSGPLTVADDLLCVAVG